MAEGDPIGDDLCSGTTDGDTLPSSSNYDEREISFGAGYALVSGTQYAIVVRALAAIDNDSVYWREGGNDLANGRAKYSGDSGSTWANDGTQDMWFKTKASAVEKDTNLGDLTIGYDIFNIKWNAQTFTASSDYTITSVVLKLNKYVTASPGTVTVSIKAVVGAAPTKASTPAPGDAAVDVTLDQATLTWVDGGGADTFDVYYGTVSGSLTKVSSAQAGASFTVTGVTDGSPYSHLITRYWRIDSTNAGGTTTGDEWSFTTIRSRPPTVTYFDTSTGDYYQLLVQADGSYGDVPGVGVEWVDYQWVTYLPNFMSTARKLVAAAENRIWYEGL